MNKLFTLIFLLMIMIFSCKESESELSLEEIESMKNDNKNELLSQLVKRPGGQDFAIGQNGGTWMSTLTSDPKTFNTQTARDADSRDIVDLTLSSLADYDPYKKQFTPNLATFKIDVDTKNDTLKVTYTLKDDIFWTTTDNKIKIPVTSDDVIFWYNEISGDEQLQDIGYSTQFVTMKNGNRAHIDIEKINEKTFVFHYPRIIANPILSTNMGSFGPKYIYEKAKKEHGIKGIKEILSIDTPLENIPSIGAYHITEYTPGVRVVMTRNPYYHKKDNNNNPLPYLEKIIYKIVPNLNTEYLLFKSGKKDGHKIKAEDLEDAISVKDRDYNIYNGGTLLSSDFLTFNQNPKAINEKVYNWFIKKEFRQAMSSIINRKRIIKQVYRGLAEPALDFFATANIYYDNDIKLKYTYNPNNAISLLKSIGIKQDNMGVMHDSEGNKIEFDITVAAANNMRVDMASIFSDEAKKIGITVNIKAIDFQKNVDMLLTTFDWHSTIVGLSANYWPTGGSNVWLSTGNFHLWNPSQKTPATDWEAEIDRLYNEGSFTIDTKKAKKIWDKYQRIILEQLPVTYIAYPLSFMAVKSKWGNVFYDTLNGLETDYLYLK